MKTQIFLVIGILMASIMAPVNAQWVEVFSPGLGFNNFYMLDSLNGWFTHLGVDKIYHTSDGGFTFEVQQVTPGNYDKNSIYMEDLNNGWCGGGGDGLPGKIHHTTNGGNTWVLMSHPAPGPSRWNDITKVGNSIWFVGGYGSNQGIMMKTSDNGQSWQVNVYPDFGIFGDIELLDEQNILICAMNNICRTSNGGVTWTKVTQNTNPNYFFMAVSFVNLSLGYSLAYNLSNSSTDLYKTTDGGFTWNLHYSWVGQGQKMGLSVIPATGTVFVGGALNSSTPYLYGILKSNDGGLTWDTVSTQGYGANYIYTPNIYNGWATDGLSIYRYSYVSPPTIEPISNKLIQFGQPFQYQVQASGLGLKYTMSGQPSGLNIGLYSGLISGTPSQVGNFPITVTVKDTDANVVNTQFSLRVNRQPVFIPPWPPTHAWVDSSYQVQLNVEDADDDTISFSWLIKPSWLTFLTEGISSVVISGTPGINDTGYHQIKVMADDGYGGKDTLSWILQVELYVPGNNAPYFIPPWPDALAYVDSLYDAMLYAEDIDGDSLYFSFLQKPTWLLMLDVIQTFRIQGVPAISDTGLHPISVMVSDNRGGVDTLTWTLLVKPTNYPPIFVGTWPDTVTVYRDSSYTWHFEFIDLDGDTLVTIPGSIQVPGLEVLPDTGVGIIAAPVTGQPAATGWYLAKVPVKDDKGATGELQFTVYVDFVSGIEPIPGLPTRYALSQNYPNPFNPVTIIRYGLPQTSEVSLTIYNLLGQEVAILVNEYQQAGIYQASFDASALPSGTYFYRLIAGNYIQTKKMVLLK